MNRQWWLHGVRGPVIVAAVATLLLAADTPASSRASTIRGVELLLLWAVTGVIAVYGWMNAVGLAVVKRLLELQGGEVVLKDRPGGGTVAEVTVPAAPG